MMVKKPERRQFPLLPKPRSWWQPRYSSTSQFINYKRLPIIDLSSNEEICSRHCAGNSTKNPHGLSVNTGNLPPPHRRRYCVHSQSDLIWNRQQKMPIYCERDFISIVRYIETFTFPISLQKLFAVSGPGPSCSQLTLLWC